MRLLSNKKAQMGLVGAAIGLLITLIICVLVYFNIAASIETDTLEDDVRESLGLSAGGDNDSWAAWNATTYVTNDTGDINDQATTFFTIAPIIVIVIVAVVVIGYVQKIGG